MYSILWDIFERLSVFFKKIVTGEKKFRDEITEMYKGIAEEIFKKSDIFDLISAQHASLFRNISDEKRQELIEKHNRFWENYGERVKKAIDDGELRDIPVEGIVGMIHGSIDSMVHNHWNCATVDELKNAIDIFMEILFNGIANKKEA